MHDTARRHGRLFFELYWDEGFHQVIELGSQDVNGSLREYCPSTAVYTGLDMAPGRGVDVVVKPGAPLPFDTESVDVAVTSSCFEHDVCFWDTFVELVRVLRPGGFLYVNAPSNSFFHRYPVDCWRFYPDAGLALVEWARRRGLTAEVVESFVAYPEAEGWCDYVAVFRKPDGQPLKRAGRIAEKTRCMNVHDWGMEPGGRLDLETPHTPDTLRLADLQARLDESRPALEQSRRDLEQSRSDLELSRKDCAELADLRLRERKALQAERDEYARLLEAERKHLQQTRSELAQSLDERNEARARIFLIERSRSWRLTAPARRLVGIFGGRRGPTS